MYPEESVQASIDAKVQNRMPVHWAGFALAQHSWFEPVERFVAKATKENQPFMVPEIGQIFTSKSNYNSEFWHK